MDQTSRSLWQRYQSLALGAAVIVVSLIIFNILSSMREDPPAKTGSGPNLNVLVRTIERGPVPVEMEAFGRIRSVAPVMLTSEVGGPVLAGEIPFLPGQKFSKGDLLLKIDDRQAKLDLMTAKSQFLNALATLLPEVKIEFPDEYNVWQRYFDQFDFDRPIARLPEPGNARIKLFLARYNVYQLYFAAQNLEIRFDKYYIRAPFDGVVVSAELRPGATARAGGNIGQVLDLSNQEVEIPVVIGETRWIRPGSEVRIISDAQKKEWPGIVTRLGSSVDPQTETISVFVRLKNGSGEVTSGQFVRAVFPPVVLENAFPMPEKAVYGDEYIYVVSNGMLKKHLIEALRHQGQQVFIGSGPAPGDTVVVQNLQGVAEGQAVAVRFEEADQ